MIFMKPLPFTLFGSALLLSTWAGYGLLYRRAYSSMTRERVVHLSYDSKRIDAQIRVSEHAVQLDPKGALGWSMLSSDYMARSRESDDLATAVKAEKAARQSLRLRTLGNVGAYNKLAQSLLQQHRFKDALSVSESAIRVLFSDDQTIRVRAETLIELGRYTEAAKQISMEPRAFQDASGQTIRARLLDIEGHPEEALSLLRTAAASADDAPAMSSDGTAWFHARVAAQLAKMGRHPESRAEYEAALSLYPRDYKAMAGLAKLAYQGGNWQEAISWGIRSDAIAQMADVRSLVGDAYEMSGDLTKAEEQYAKVAALVGRPSGMNDGLHEVAPGAGTHGHRLDRQYALYCADHQRDSEGAYAAALRDFDSRQDIYAFDTLGWVCYHSGKLDEAKIALDKAMKLGTRDPMLFYHAGAIYIALGQNAKGAQFLSEALAIDPSFDPVAAPKAAQLLSARKG